jgi:hypothetical protein
VILSLISVDVDVYVDIILKAFSERLLTDGTVHSIVKVFVYVYVEVDERG